MSKNEDNFNDKIKIEFDGNKLRAHQDDEDLEVKFTVEDFDKK